MQNLQHIDPFSLAGWRINWYAVDNTDYHFTAFQLEQAGFPNGGR